MIYTYGVTLQGTYHVKKGTVCQDAHKIVKCADNFCVAAVADGLGSEAHSDIASKLAVDVAVTYCAKTVKVDMSDQEIERIICTSFHEVQKAIEEESGRKQHDLDQYDTTLSLVVLIDSKLYYGHSGDSGIVAFTAEGLYVKITEQQRDDENRVFPLYFGEEKWVFDTYDKKVASVFLATDGIYETLFPLYIRYEPVNIHVSLARYFMDNSLLKIDEYGEDEVCKKIEAFLMGIPDALVNDDKTVVVIVDTSIQTVQQAPEYYNEPDWKELKRNRDEEWKKKAYPHMYK